MIELILKNFLSEKLNVPVLLEIPADPPTEFVLIEHTGGGDTGVYLQSSMVAIQSYGNSLADAATLNGKIKKAMWSLSELPEICRCTLNTDYNFTDLTTKHYRYQAVYDIIYYREE